jgi:fatty-acid desaturase
MAFFSSVCLHRVNLTPAMHLFAVYGMFVLSPWSQLSWKTTVLCFISWQLASFGITLGYHRLWSHRAYTATTPARVVLAWMGCMGFQGSIKWWVLRHRLHHRYVFLAICLMLALPIRLYTILTRLRVACGILTAAGSSASLFTLG